MTTPKSDSSPQILGYTVSGCYITGIGGILAAVVSLVAGNLIAGGLFLIASAISFGLLAVGFMALMR